MYTYTLSPARRLRGVINVPGDKSISHRAVLLNSLAAGEAQITHFLPGADCRSTIACMRALGVEIIHAEPTSVTVRGRALRAGLREATDVLDCANSGTTLRLLTGILAGQAGLFAILTGDESLRSRPQRRIVTPLRALGASLDGRQNGDRAPLVVRGASLRGGSYELPVASAQVKSAILLAGLAGEGPLTLSGRIDSRDHTERMLRTMGVDLQEEQAQLRLTPPEKELQACSLRVPGDPSSAAFWWVAAAIHPDAELTTTGVCLNPSRTGALDVLRAMGADISIENERLEGSEPIGDVTVRSSNLHGTSIGGSLIPRLIDEIPVLAVAASSAQGDTLVYDAQELRAKETDRVETVASGLDALGATVEPTIDGMGITGGQHLHGAVLQSHGDHRLAMAWAIAGLLASGETRIHGADAVDVSYPGFWETLENVKR